MTKATDPKNQSNGSATRATIQTNMSNNPRGNEFKSISYSGKEVKAPK